MSKLSDAQGLCLYYEIMGKPATRNRPWGIPPGSRLETARIQEKLRLRRPSGHIHRHMYKAIPRQVGVVVILYKMALHGKTTCTYKTSLKADKEVGGCFFS